MWVDCTACIMITTIIIIIIIISEEAALNVAPIYSTSSASSLIYAARSLHIQAFVKY